MNQILLSICIPTYKRSNYLKRALESLEIQLANNSSLADIVEVIVSDNCSPDDTKEVVLSFQSRIKNLTYAYNEKNVGFDMNIYNIVTKASGKYCWYLGDDDIIINGGLEHMCNTIKDDKYDFIGVEAQPLDEESDAYKTKKDFSDQSTIKIDNFNDFYFKGYCQGGVSALAFNRSMWLQEVNKDDFLEHWLYYDTVLRILVATKKQMSFISDAIVLTGQDCRWAENGTELFTFTNSNILLERMIKYGFDKNRVETELNKNSKKILIMLLRAKSNNLKCNIKNLKYIYKNLTRLSSINKVLVTLIYFIPNFLIKFIKEIKKNIGKLIATNKQ